MIRFSYDKVATVCTQIHVHEVEHVTLSFYQIIDFLLEMTPLLNKTVFQVVIVQIQTHLLIDVMGGWWR